MNTRKYKQNLKRSDKRETYLVAEYSGRTSDDVIQGAEQKSMKNKSWWFIGFEGNSGVKIKETRVCNNKGK